MREKYSVARVASVWRDCFGETHTELLTCPSHLTRAYLSGIVVQQWVRGLRILGLQMYRMPMAKGASGWYWRRPPSVSHTRGSQVG